MRTRHRHLNLTAALAVLAAALAVSSVLWPVSPEDKAASFIVQGQDVARAAAAVRQAGGTVTHELGIIQAVGARLTAAQASQLTGECPQCRLYDDRSARLMGKPGVVIPDSDFPTLVGADELHEEGLLGTGVTIAVVDSGVWPVNPITKDPSGSTRILAQYDAFADVTETRKWSDNDDYGHGTHVSAIAVASSISSTGRFHGVAPGANLVSVKAFDELGGSTYATVIRAIDWVVQNKDTYQIRVLNASFGASVASYYWDDPINQAVMQAWRAGIVVVTSAGNTGPGPMTIQVPGNLPYVITVGAMTDNYTPADGNDDFLASFSAAGPTYEGHVKPDLVAPGGHILAFENAADWLGRNFPEYFVTGELFRLSGTSQAAAAVSGVAALILQKRPHLEPDDVKCALIASANPAVDPTGDMAYSIFQQGAGLVDAWEALVADELGCANSNLDIELDLAGLEHYGGPAWQDEDGDYYILGAEDSGLLWDGTYASGDGYPWANGYPWSNGYPWANSYPWANGYPWANSYPWSNSNPDSDGMDSTTGDSGSTYVTEGPVSVPPSTLREISVVKTAPQE